MYKRSTDEFLFAVHDVNALLLLTQALTGKIINCIRALRVLRDVRDVSWVVRYEDISYHADTVESLCLCADEERLTNCLYRALACRSIFICPHRESQEQPVVTL